MTEETLPQGPSLESLGDEPELNGDARWAYAEMTKEQAWTAWPCDECGTRRDEHADQRPLVLEKLSLETYGFPTLDITDHRFTAKEGSTE